MNIQEEVDVEFLDVEDEEAQGAAEKEIEDAENQQKEKEAELRELPEQDTTGRNAAASTYNVIETSIVSYFSQLSNEDDQEIFIDWLITNLKMYFDKWEKELSGKVQEPTNTEYEQQAQETEAEASHPLHHKKVRSHRWRQLKHPTRPFRPIHLLARRLLILVAYPPKNLRLNLML